MKRFGRILGIILILVFLGIGLSACTDSNVPSTSSTQSSFNRSDYRSYASFSSGKKYEMLSKNGVTGTGYARGSGSITMYDGYGNRAGYYEIASGQTVKLYIPDGYIIQTSGSITIYYK